MRTDTHDSGSNIRDEWVKQIYFFKNHCHQTYKVHVFDDVSTVIKHEIEVRTMESKNEEIEGRRLRKIEDDSAYTMEE